MCLVAFPGSILVECKARMLLASGCIIAFNLVAGSCCCNESFEILDITDNWGAKQHGTNVVGGIANQDGQSSNPMVSNKSSWRVMLHSARKGIMSEASRPKYRHRLRAIFSTRSLMPTMKTNSKLRTTFSYCQYRHSPSSYNS